MDKSVDIEVHIAYITLHPSIKVFDIYTIVHCFIQTRMNESEKNNISLINYSGYNNYFRVDELQREHTNI